MGSIGSDLDAGAFNFCEGDAGGSFDEADFLLYDAPDMCEDPSDECARIPEELSFAACDPNACYVHESYFACFTVDALAAQFQGVAPLLVGLSADELYAVFGRGSSSAFDNGAWNDARQHVILPLDAHWPAEPAPPLGAFAALAVVGAAALGRLRSLRGSPCDVAPTTTARRARNRCARTAPRNQKQRSRERPSPVVVAQEVVRRRSSSDDPPTPFSASSSDDEAGGGLAQSTSGAPLPAASVSGGASCQTNDDQGAWESGASKRAQKRQNRARCAAAAAAPECVAVLGSPSAHLATAAPSLARAHLSPIAAEFKPAHAIDEPLEGVPLVRFGDF